MPHNNAKSLPVTASFFHNIPATGRDVGCVKFRHREGYRGRRNLNVGEFKRPHQNCSQAKPLSQAEGLAVFGDNFLKPDQYVSATPADSARSALGRPNAITFESG